ncbi:MAG: hypothetical protein U1A78_28960 [Polyangia bacterium]
MVKVGTEGGNRARSPLYKLSYLAVTLLLGSTCGYDQRPPETGRSTAAEPQASGVSAQHDAGLRAAYVRAQQAQGAELPSLHFTPGPDGLSARHPEQGYSVRLLGQGLELTIGSEKLVLGPPELRCGSKRMAGARTAAQLGATPHRGEYAGGAISEWYENGPLGLEQGFTLREAPDGCERGAPLRVELSVSGLRAESAGADAAFVNAAGQRVLRYSDLFVRDHKGATLPSRLRTGAEGRAIVLEVDWAEAEFPIEIDPLIWNEQKKLVAGDKASLDYFGSAVALSADGNTALIGAWMESDGTTAANGAAYVFVRSGTSWVQQQKLLAGDKASGDYFGSAVALSADGNTALIGADGESDSGTLANGAVYVFARSGTSWSQQQKLLASDKAAHEAFGWSVALSGDGSTALVGADGESDGGTLANGAAYVFVRSIAGFVQQQKLLASDKASGSGFGWSVALARDGSTALVGANAKTEGTASRCGAAYVFSRSGTSWSEQQKLLASDKESGDSFGESVALSADGNTALIGAVYEDDSGTTNSGAAYVFTRSGTSFRQEQKLLAGDKDNNDWFGSAVALSPDGQIGFIGAVYEDDGGTTNSGAVYGFARGAGGWSQQQKLQASDKESEDRLGSGLALSADGSTALVGAIYEGDSFGTTNSGAAYVFNLPPGKNGIPCTGSYQCASGFCVDGVCCENACGGGLGSDCQVCSRAAGGTSDGTCGPASVDTVCRPSAGACDSVELCDGTSLTCKGDGVKAAGTLCRSSAGACDEEERCSGTSAQCPPDALAAGGTVCRASAGACDAPERCSGTSAQCPADALATAGTVCRAAAGPCDAEEQCSGTSAACPADKLLSGTVCRAAAGPCDYDEKCSGTSAACPADRLKSGTICRSAAGPCDVEERCSGTSATCPANQYQSNTTVCRASAGPCDLAEFCSGTRPSCPADQYKPIFVVCRPSLGACDLADYCTGTSPACAPDDLQPAGTVCRPSSGSCDPAESCSGANPLCPADKLEPDGTTCAGGMCRAGMCI